MEATEIVTPNLTDGSGVARTVDQASAGAHRAIDKATDAVRPMMDRVAAGAHQAVDKVASAAGHAADTLGARGEQLKHAQAQALEHTRMYVRENPMVSLGIALAAGFILSKILSSR